MRQLTLIISIFLVACSTHQSPRQAAKGEQFLFVTNSEEAIFRAAYDAMIEVRTDVLVTDIEGPVRGYRMTQQPFLDKYTTMIRVFRAEGENRDSKTIRGYYPEVSGSGTIFLGPATDREVYSLVLKKFEAIGQKKNVSALRRIDYLLERDRWRLHETPFLGKGGFAKGSKKSVRERLKKLDNLRQEGAVSETEYKNLRKNILNDL